MKMSSEIRPADYVRTRTQRDRYIRPATTA